MTGVERRDDALSGSGDSFVALAGTICSVKPSATDAGRHFILRNRDGIFAIHIAPDLARLVGPALQPNAEVCVLGRATTYYHQRRRSNQVVIEAAAVAPVEIEAGPGAPALSPLLLSLVKLVAGQISRSLAVLVGPPDPAGAEVVTPYIEDSGGGTSC